MTAISPTTVSNSFLLKSSFSATRSDSSLQISTCNFRTRRSAETPNKIRKSSECCLTLLITVNRIFEGNNSASLIRACAACELDSNWRVWRAAGVGAGPDWAMCYSLARFNHRCRPNGSYSRNHFRRYRAYTRRVPRASRGRRIWLVLFVASVVLPWAWAAARR